jgi:glycosyltransferase involved in cell wall biosynthesis
MNIVFVGKTDFKYNRTAILWNGLSKIDGVKLQQLSLRKRNKEESRALQALAANADYVFVPAFRHNDLGFVKKHVPCPVVYDALLSEYLTKVIDYQQYWKAPIKYLIDYKALHKADIIIADTQAYGAYLQRTFKLSQPILPIYVGVDLEEFSVKDKSSTTAVFNVGFYGSFNPLQGVERIIEAAELLINYPEIQFQLIGGGSTFQKVQALCTQKKLNNVHFLGWMSSAQLADRIASFELCLWIFGTSKKTDLVVPNKVFHYAALHKAIISKDTPAIREVFADKENIMLCSYTSESIAKAILECYENAQFRDYLGSNAGQLMQESYSEKHIATTLLNHLQQIGASY